MHFTYTPGFHLLEELLPDFWPVCCDSDGDVLQVSLHLSITLWAEGLERETHFTTARVHARAGKQGLMHLTGVSASLWFTFVILYRASSSCEMNSSSCRVYMMGLCSGWHSKLFILSVYLLKNEITANFI